MGLKATELIRLLQDERVREEIRSIAKENPDTDRKTGIFSVDKVLDNGFRNKDSEKALYLENERLKRELSIKKDELSEAMNKISQEKLVVERLRLETEKAESTITELKLKSMADAELMMEFREKLQRAEEEKDRIAREYATPEKYLILYRQLSDGTRNSLGKVVCDRDMIHFICSLSNQDSLRCLWEYIKGILSYDSLSTDVNILKEIFFYFFELYNSSLSEPVFKLDETRRGDEYSDDLHAKARGSASSGYISEVLLIGYKSVNTGRPVCKSVVYV